MHRDELRRDVLLQRLLDISQRSSEESLLSRAERCVAGMVGRSLQLLPLPADADILPFLPQLVHAGLGGMSSMHDGRFEDLRREFEQEVRHSFANFAVLRDTEEAFDQTLLMVERVMIAATANEFVAADIKAALRANRYMAEYAIATFCRTAVGQELLQLAYTSHRAGQFGNVLVQSGRDDDGDVLLRLTFGPELAFEFAWDGVGCDLAPVLGDITPERIDDMMGDVLEHWNPAGFIEI